MTKNIPMYIFVIMLIAIISIAISVVVLVYNNNKPIEPHKYMTVLSSNDMSKIKGKYEDEDKKQEFLELCSKIELAVANRLLDGTVTNDDELALAIEKINSVLDSDDWSYLELEASNYWMGKWSLDSKGAVTFAFQDDSMKPSWTQDEDVIKYIK